MTAPAPSVGSLYAGIGGIDRGLEAAGWRVAWQSEIDRACRRVLAHQWPDAQLYGDVRALGRHTPPVTMLAGGFPCQDVSNTGKQAGMARTTRSGLWHEFLRLIRQLGPRYVLVENVTGLRSRGLDRVLGDLAGVGYDAEWTCFRAADLGAPHERARLWLVAYPHREGRPERPRIFGPSWWAESQDRCRARGGISGQAAWAAEPGLGRVADGLPGRVDRVRGLGNAVVPACAQMVGAAIMEDLIRDEPPLPDR